jgi:hypothetical protein
MNTANALPANRNQLLYSILIYLFICVVYTALLFYTAYLFYADAEKLHTYFTNLITAANDQLKFCFR